jgi:hypothetical protein
VFLAVRFARDTLPPGEPARTRFDRARGERARFRLTSARLASMIEAAVQAAFVDYLIERGWEVTTDNADYTDVIARRGDELLLAEVKGTTTSAGLDVDTAYGQLLRRIRERPEAARYALVVPESALRAALRVSDEVRRRLGMDVWVVDEAGNVQLVG